MPGLALAACPGVSAPGGKELRAPGSTIAADPGPKGAMDNKYNRWPFTAPRVSDMDLPEPCAPGMTNPIGGEPDPFQI